MSICTRQETPFIQCFWKTRAPFTPRVMDPQPSLLPSFGNKIKNGIADESYMACAAQRMSDRMPSCLSTPAWNDAMQSVCKPNEASGRPSTSSRTYDRHPVVSGRAKIRGEAERSGSKCEVSANTVFEAKRRFATSQLRSSGRLWDVMALELH